MSNQKPSASKFLDYLEDAYHLSRFLFRYICSLDTEIKEIEITEDELRKIISDLYKQSYDLEKSLSGLSEEWRNSIRPAFQKGYRILEAETEN